MSLYFTCTTVCQSVYPKQDVLQQTIQGVAYSQWQGNNMKTEPPRLETEEYWKKPWGSVKYEERDSTKTWHDSYLLAKETNWTPGNTACALPGMTKKSLWVDAALMDSLTKTTPSFSAKVIFIWIDTRLDEGKEGGSS